MEKTQGIEKKSLFFGNINRKSISFAALLIFILLISLIVIVYNIDVFGRNTFQGFESFADLSVYKATETVELLSKEIIKEKSLCVANQIKVYLNFQGNYNINVIRDNIELKNIAVQSVGKTGYTAVHNLNAINHFHVNPALVGFDLHNLAEKTS